MCTIDLSLRYLLLNQLVYLRRRYRVIGVSSPGPEVPTLEAAGIRHVPVAMTRRFSPLPDLAAVLDLTRVFQRERVEIVHTHNPKPGLLGQLAARLAGVPVVVNTLHGFYFHDHMRPLPRRFYVLMEQLAAAQSDCILSQNPEDVQTAIEEHIAPPTLIEHLGNGIDLHRFRPRSPPTAPSGPATTDGSTQRTAFRRRLGIGADDIVIGFVGRLVREKGLDELFAAVAMVRRQRPACALRLLVVGPSDPEKPDAVDERAAAAAGIDDITIFTGLRQDLPELYDAMDIFVLPSHREGFPRSPMEAAAMGRPVIATDIRGCRETVVDRQTGYLVPVRSPPDLAEAMLRLIDEPLLRCRFGEAGRYLAEARFDERLVFARVEATYERLLSLRGRR